MKKEKLVISDQAKNDLSDIWLYIAGRHRADQSNNRVPVLLQHIP